MLRTWPLRGMLIVLHVLCAAWAQEDWPRPTVTALPLTGEVTVDGVLEESTWQTGDWATGFTSASAGPENAGAPRHASVQTRFKVRFTPTDVYVGVECDEPRPEAMRAECAEHDSMVFTDDCVEIFLDPAGQGRYYHHFVVNSRGAWYDDYGADFGLVHKRLWHCALETGTHVDVEGKRWTVEVRIPLGGLILNADAGPVWLWNVCRERYAGGQQELTSWSPLKGNFHTPSRFGTMTGVNVDFGRFALRLGETQVALSGDGSGAWDVAIRVPVTNETGADRQVTASAWLFGRRETQVISEPVDLPAGATVELTLPKLRIRGVGLEANVVLELVDAGSGELLRSEVRQLVLDYRPVDITILRPCYRNCIYASETIEEIVFRVRLAPDVAARAQAVSCELRDQAGNVLEQAQVEVGKLGEPVGLPAANLREGRYTLRAMAVDGAGGELGTATETLRKLPPPPAGNEVRVDEFGNILVNGKPFVGIGWYGSPETADPRADVVALQNLQTPVVPIRGDASAIRDAFSQYGIYSIVSVENGRLLYSFELWRQPDNPVPTEQTRLSAPSEEAAGYLAQLVEQVRAEPGLLGYYISDEPEINNVRSDYLENQYKLMRELDPYHPVIVTNDTLDGIITHGYRCADILSPDPYSPDYDYVPNFMKRCLEVMGPGQTVLLTPWHSSEQAHFVRDWGSAPPYPYRVMRNQYLASLAHGARGWTGYTSPFFMAETELRYGLPYIWREVRFLERAMAAPPPQVPLKIDADAPMAGWLRKADGLLYLVVVNHKPGARQVTVSHPLLRGVQRLIVVSEGREVQVQDGAFTDLFAEGDARIYTTDLRGHSFATTREVEEELARRRAQTARPGNLLHVSRGVRVSASEGYYAPWFHQYYWYAVNGIHDDTGWTVSHAGSKPAWLELTLPAPTTVGRVVLYTPNLKDYDLQIQGPEGEVAVAEVRGNERTVVEHSFSPPLRCLKLRVTALASREGAPQLAEIEAYEEQGASPPTPVTFRTAASQAPVTFIPAADWAAPNALWSDDFTNFQSRDRYYWDGHDVVWVVDPERHRVTPLPEGGLLCTSPAGGAGMSRILPYDPEYRFFQVKIRSIEGEGYKFVNVGFGDSSGQKRCRGAVNTNRPGIYTVDTHYVHESFRNGTAKNCFVTTYMGAIACIFDWMRLVRRPVDGLAVTLADGSPLPETLGPGDALLFHLILNEPAVDATVSTLAGPSYAPLPINNQPYVQLVKVGNADGREWAAVVALGEGTGSYDAASVGYPVVFRATVIGGGISETWATASVSFKAASER